MVKMKKLFLITIFMILLAAGIAVAVDTRAPTASIAAADTTIKARHDATIRVIARDIGHGNLGLASVKVTNADTNEVVLDETLDGEYIFSREIEVNEPKGTYSYKVEVKDKAGNKGIAGPTSITFINNAPTIRITNPNDNDTISTGSVDVRYTVTDLDTEDNLTIRLEYSDDGETLKEIETVTDRSQSNITWDTRDLADGRYDMHVIVIDNEEAFGQDEVHNLTITNPAKYNITDVNPTLVSAGDIVTIKFTTSRDLGANPIVSAMLENATANATIKLATYVVDDYIWYEYEYDTTGDAEGWMNITIQGTNTYGVNSTQTFGRQFYIDNTAPEINKIRPKNGTVVKTNIFKVNASIRDENGMEKAEVDYGKGIQRMLLVDGDSLYEAELTLEDGSHTLTIIAEDKAGNIQNESFDITVNTTAPIDDNQSPIINLTSPLNGSFTNDVNATITANITDDNSIDTNSLRVVVKNNGTIMVGVESFDAATGVLSYSMLDELKNGEVNVTITAADNMSNTATKDFVFYIDTIVPTINITSPSNGSNVDSSFTIAYDYNETYLDRFEIQVDNGAWTNVSTNTSHLIEDLTITNHTINVRVFDKGGNVAQDNITVEVISDNSAPNIQWIYPQNGTKIEQQKVPITLYVTDNELVESVKVNNVALTGTNGIYRGDLVLAEGTHVLTATATDISGNYEMDSITVIIDLHKNGDVAGYVKSSEGGAIFNANVSIYNQGTLEDWTYTDSNGQYSFNVLPGEYTIRANYMDHLEETATVNTSRAQTVNQNFTLQRRPDIKVNSLVVGSKQIQHQAINITTVVRKIAGCADEEYINLTLNVDGTDVEERSVILDEDVETFEFNYTPTQAGYQNITITADTLGNETNTLDNSMLTQINVDDLSEYVVLDVFAPPFNITNGNNFTATVIASNKGTINLENIQLGALAMGGAVTINDDNTKTVNITAGTSETIKWGFTASQAGTGTIVITAYDLSDSDTVNIV